MRRNTPLITLLTGAALGVILLIASMLVTPSSTPVSYSAADASSASSSPSAASSSPSAPAAASSSSSSSAPATEPSAVPAATSAPAPASSAAAAPSPTHATYAGRVGGGGGSVAVAIHGSQAIAYVCNGSTVEAWMRGTATGGKLVMTGKDGAKLTATYSHRRVAGDVAAHGTDYSFAVHLVNKPSGLYQATAAVRGAKVKAGWIVLPDGSQVGAFESDANSGAPSAVEAPMLDVATGTARAGNLTLYATPVDGFTGSGF
jgi:hypothetical protein